MIPYSVPGNFEAFAHDGYMHIRPREDLVTHILSDECPCGPSSRLHSCPAHEDHWYVIHHSLDGRENGLPLRREDVLGR